MERPLTRPPPSGTLSPGRGLSFLVGAQVIKAALSPGRGLSFLVGAQVIKAALSLGERVDRDPDAFHRDAGRVRGPLHGEEGSDGPT